MRPWLGGVLALLLCAAIPVAYATVGASIDNTQIGAGQTVQLTLTYNGITTSEPDLSPLQQDFAILGTSTSTSVEFGTGGESSSTQVVLTLSPKVTGILTIPAITWNGQQSAPLSLTVTGSGSAPAGGSGSSAGNGGAAPGVFIQDTATPTNPYVQAAVQVTVQIFTSGQLRQGSLDFSGNGAELIRKVGSDAYSSAVRNGQNYQVITRHYLLFPMHSGRLSIPGPELDAEVATRSTNSWNPFGNFFGALVQSTRPIRVRGNPISLTVKPRPAGANGSYWLPAENLTLTSQWQSGTQAQAGNPLTVELDLKAVGLTAAQLPDLTTQLLLPAGLTAYPDQAKLTDTAQGNGLVGERDQTVALIADHPGHYTIPGITVHWWDTVDNQPRTATVPAQTLTILPGAGGMVAATPAASSAQTTPGTSSAPSPPVLQSGASSPLAATSNEVHSAVLPAVVGEASLWKWVAAGFAALWLLTLGFVGGWLWMKYRMRSAPAPMPTAPQPTRRNASKEQAAFRAACSRNDALAARRHLLGWAEGAWGSAPAGLQALAAALGDASPAATLVRELERACYGGGEWHGQPLAAALRELPLPSRPSTQRRSGLGPLYP